jgi:glutamyl-tRNA reductase
MTAFVVPGRLLSALGRSASHLEPLGLSPLVAMHATTVQPGTTAAAKPASTVSNGVMGAIVKEAKREADATVALDTHVMGLSIHHAAVDVREKLAIKGPEWALAAAELVAYSNGVVKEAAVLSTCNRFEIYLGAADAKAAFSVTAKFFAERSGLGQAVLRRNLFMLSGEDAGWHLLRVAAGLDSLVVGEGQILAQTAACYAAATQLADDETGAVAGSGGKVLSRLLNTAVAAGKRARAETAISKGAVSISSAAVEFSQKQLPLDLGLPLSGARVVIVGAGTMTRLLVTHLKSHGVSKIVLVNRSVGPGSRAQELADEHPEVAWDLRTPDHMYAAMAECDVAYMSTSAEEPIVTVDGLTQHVFGIRDVGAKALSVVDISVPRNVETAVDQLAGVFSYNVDDLKAVVARNTASRQREMLEAESLLREELAAYRGWHQSLGAVPTIAKLQASAEVMREAEFNKNQKQLKNLSDKELEAVERLSRGIVNKLLHGPMAHLRAPENQEDKRRTLSTLSALFKLDDDGKKKGKK